MKFKTPSPVVVEQLTEVFKAVADYFNGEEDITLHCALQDAFEDAMDHLEVQDFYGALNNAPTTTKSRKRKS